jgi:twinkle protein
MNKGIVTGITKRTLDTMEEFNEIRNLPITALATRGIDQDVAEHFGIHTAYSTATGEPEAHYYPFTVAGKTLAYKKRTLPKSFCSIGASLKGVPVEFMGQSTCVGPGKKLLITEGQDDAAAAFQMLWRKYPDFKPSVVSLPHGANLAAFKDNADFLGNFEEIIFCPDSDEPGQKLAADVSALLDNVKIMKISEHDANDMLRAGKHKEFINAFFRSSPQTPEGFVSVDDVFAEATSMPVWGRSWPWPSLTALTYGRRLGEGMYIGAGAKIGKSEFVNQMAKHIIVEEQRSVALFKLEEKPAMTARRIAGKIMHQQFHVPDGDFTQEQLIEGVTMLRDKIHMYDSYKATSWDTLKVAIRHAVLVGGCQDIMIDPITRLTAGMDPSSTNTELERFADEISAMAKDLGFFYYCFAHLKSPQTGKPHEEGGRVHSNQFTGSRAMMRACYYMLGIERDKSPDLPDQQRNMSSFVLLDDRAFGNAGRFDVFYHDNGDYLELEREFM